MHGGFVHLRHVLPARLSDISPPPLFVPVVETRRHHPSLILLQLLQIQGYPPALLLRLPLPVSNGRDFVGRRNGLQKKLLKLLKQPLTSMEPSQLPIPPHQPLLSLPHLRN